MPSCWRKKMGKCRECERVNDREGMEMEERKLMDVSI